MEKPLFEYDPKELNLALLGTLQSALIAKLMLVNSELSGRYRKLVELSEGMPNADHEGRTLLSTSATRCERLRATLEAYIAEHNAAQATELGGDGGSLDPLRQGIRLGAVETERANKLFPDDEREAVYELMRRAKELPDLRKALVIICAKNLIDGERMPGGASDWINAEVERAKKLHPKHDAEAINAH